MANRTKWTSEKRVAFLARLRETCNVTLAAEAVGMGRQYMYQLRAADDAFAADWDNAIDEAVDRLEAEVHRRAFTGIDEPIVYQGKIQADEFGKPLTVKKYSDTLATFLLKAHRPEKYRERHEHNHSGELTIISLMETVDGRTRGLPARGK